MLHPQKLTNFLLNGEGFFLDKCEIWQKKYQNINTSKYHNIKKLSTLSITKSQLNYFSSRNWNTQKINQNQNINGRKLKEKKNGYS
jgi:hypothetical protein